MGDPVVAPTSPKKYRISEADRAEMIRRRRKVEQITRDFQSFLDSLADKYDPPFYPVNFDVVSGEMTQAGAAPVPLPPAGSKRIQRPL